MKKVCSILLAGVLLFGILSGASFSVSGAGTPDITTLYSEGEYTYHLNQDGETVTLNAYKGKDTDVIVPSVLGGYPVTDIGSYAFSNHYDLASVVIPEGVTWIGTWSFAGCSNLTSIAIPGSVTEIGGYAFSGCTKLTGVTLPGSVTKIGTNAFSCCEGLTGFIIPGSITEIDIEAFRGCTGVTSIEIPLGVEIMQTGVFEGCEELTDIYCLAPEKPAGWEDEWVGSYCNATVHWGKAMRKLSTGDLGGDGEIDATDYMLLKRAVLETYTLTEEQRAAADINGDGEVNATDYMLLKRAVLGTFVIG